MKAFTDLFDQLDRTTKTNVRISAIVDYFKIADKNDVVWAIAMLTGRRPKRPVRTSDLRIWASELAGLPLWLFEESYHVTGDLAEAINLMLPPASATYEGSLTEVMELLSGLAALEDDLKKARVTDLWKQMEGMTRFVFNKLITGSFRIGVSQNTVIKALAIHTGKEESVIAHKLSGDWSPINTTWHQLLESEDGMENASRPYPFYLAYQLDKEVEELGKVDDWLIERKYDGIRGQIIVRNSNIFIWSRGEELMTEKFPEFHCLAKDLPDGTVIDGEILPYKAGAPLPFHLMQTRIGRKNITKKHLEEAPLVMIAYDLLEFAGEDIRHLHMTDRRHKLEQTIQDNFPVLKLSPLITCKTWNEISEARENAREHRCEGLMLKLKDSPYETGRRRGKWWKWKVDPMSIDAVLIYAQRGSGRRANLYTDYTFAVWKDGELVPFAKAYSGLTDKEILQVDDWVRKHTIEKFGPVRSVKPELVFELGFEGINPSSRHRSGVAVRFPRILRRRLDKIAAEADTHESLLRLLEMGQKV